MEDQSPLLYRGISLNGTDNSVVECNYITGNATATDFEEAIGIYVSDAPAGVRCNDISNTKIGINFNGQCLVTNIIFTKRGFPSAWEKELVKPKLADSIFLTLIIPRRLQDILAIDGKI
jgi:hypothetical protein